MTAVQPTLVTSLGDPTATSCGASGQPGNVRLNKIVPPTGPAHLDDVDGELARRGVERLDLGHRSRRSVHSAEVLAEDPRHQRDRLFSTDGTDLVGLLTVELRSSHQVRVGVAHRFERCSAGSHTRQTLASRECEVHSLAVHAPQGRRARIPTRRVMQINPRRLPISCTRVISMRYIGQCITAR